MTHSTQERIQDRISETRHLRERIVEVNVELRDSGLDFAVKLLDAAVLHLGAARRAVARPADVSSVTERLARRMAALNSEQSRLRELEAELGPHHVVEAARHVGYAITELHELRGLLTEEVT